MQLGEDYPAGPQKVLIKRCSESSANQTVLHQMGCTADCYQMQEVLPVADELGPQDDGLQEFERPACMSISGVLCPGQDLRQSSGHLAPFQ